MTGAAETDVGVPEGVTLLIGGARSGKSSLAVDIARRWAGPVDVVATAARVDAEMTARIERHRLERPATWHTVEETLDIAGAVRSARARSLVVVDCLTVWVGNLLHARHDAGMEGLAEQLADALAERATPTVVVTNEVGLGIVPDNALARQYRDALGAVNRTIAARADRVLLMAAGRALPLRDPWEILG